jgi:hypothetical protein
MVYTRPNYASGQDDVPTRTEECLCVRSENRQEADRGELIVARSPTVETTRICYNTCYITRSDRLVYTRCNRHEYQESPWG